MSAKKIYFGQPALPFDEFDVTAQHAAEPSVPISAAAPETADSEVWIEADTKKPEDALTYISFGSGSSGNSCYLGTSAGGIIIDAGIRPERIEEELKLHGIRMSHVKALLLTHDHSDHVRHAYPLLRSNRHMSLYCTPRVLNGLLRRHNISKRIKEYHTPIFKEIPFKVGRFEITAFDVPHDGSDNMGYHIAFGRHTFVLATDLGMISERADHYMRLANYLVIEANYDSDMLRLGRYPEYLKARIRAANGHMDNAATAAFLADIASDHLQYVFLCHLSKDNNTPAKALKAVRDALQEKGLKVGNAEILDESRADILLMALPRFDATRRFIFR